MVEELTLRDIKRVERLECKAKRITKLERDFFQRLSEHIQRLKNEYEKALKKEHNSSKTMILFDDLKKIEALEKDIYIRRERKIVLLALETVNGAEHDLKFLSENERETYHRIVESLTIGRDSFYGIKIAEEKNIKSVKKEVFEKTETIEKIQNNEINKESEIIEEKKIIENKESNEIIKPEKVEETKPGLDYSIIRILEDIPSFVAFDLKSYNLSKEDIVTLPKDNAEFLCNNGKAIEIDVNIK